jgi:hypothetical protein
MSNLVKDSSITLYVKKSDFLPDNKLWKNRFEIRSESSDRVYIVSQNIIKGHMGCSCPGWRRYRTCKHLQALGLPGHEVPVTLNLKSN